MAIEIIFVCEESNRRAAEKYPAPKVQRKVIFRCQDVFLFTGGLKRVMTSCSVAGPQEAKTQEPVLGV